MWFQTSSQFSSTSTVSLCLLKSKIKIHTQLFSAPPDLSRVQILPFASLQLSSLNFEHEVNPCFLWHQYPIQSLQTWNGTSSYYLSTDNHDLYYSVHCTWELKFVWWMFFHEEIYLNHLLLYEMFYINLFSPFKAGIPKASLTIGNSTTTLQLTWYTERTILPESFLAECFFSLSWLSLEFTC